VDLELAEGSAFEHVGKRLVVGTARHRGLDRRYDLRRGLPRAVPRELLDLDPERVGDQRLRVAPRLLAAGRGDLLRGGVEQLADGRGGRTSPATGLHCVHSTLLLV